MCDIKSARSFMSFFARQKETTKNLTHNLTHTGYIHPTKVYRLVCKNRTLQNTRHANVLLILEILKLKVSLESVNFIQDLLLECSRTSFLLREEWKRLPYGERDIEFDEIFFLKNISRELPCKQEEGECNSKLKKQTKK